VPFSDTMSFKFYRDITEMEKEAVSSFTKNLLSQHLPIILSERHFATITGLKLDFLYSVSNHEKSFYRTFKIQKKSGGSREINAPLPVLMSLQKWILSEILEKRETSVAATAYKKGLSTKNNARIHRGQKYILKLDIEGFFDNLNFEKVYSVFFKMGYTKPVSLMLAKVCLRDGVLPQGAPTSGLLANIILDDFDQNVLSFCREQGFRYTRYSDDLTISGPSKRIKKSLSYIKNLLGYNALRLNESKTRLVSPGQRKIVTGIVVNQILNAPKEMVLDLRQQHYYIVKFGLYRHASVQSWKNVGLELDRLIGKAAYISNIRPKNLYFKKIHRELLLVRDEVPDLKVRARLK